MLDLIQSVEFRFPQLQRDAAEAAILSRRLAGEIQSPDQAREVLRRLLDRISSIQGAMVRHPDFESFRRLSSDKWNNFAEGLFIDLRTIYDSVSTLESTARQMEVIASSDLKQTKAAILKAINQLRVYQFLKDNPEYQDLKIVDFLRAINETQKRPPASIDNDIRMLELPAKSRQVVSSSRQNTRRTTVTTRVLGGGTLSGFGEDFAAKNMLNPNEKNFWVEMMSVKTPVAMNYKASWGTYKANGIVAEIETSFSHVERVNNLKLLPFTEYPYNIIDISYKETPSSKNWLTLPDFRIKEAVEDWVEFSFKYIAVATLRVTIEQQNYVRNINLVPESLLRRNHLWSQLRASEYSRDVHEIDLTTRQSGLVDIEPEQLRHLVALERLDVELNSQTYQGFRHTEHKDYSKYIESINRVTAEIAPDSSQDVQEVIDAPDITEDEKVRELASYDYLLGIRVLELSSILYEPIAYYESGEFITNGTVVEVQLDTDEFHNTFFEDDGKTAYRRTSVEYEVEVASDTRYPVVPVSEIDDANYIVRDEYLKMKRGKAKLRFTPGPGSFSVRKNGKRINAQDVTLDGRDIYISNPDSHSIYTATYHVTEDATKVQVDTVLNSTRLPEPEEFEGTDPDNKITLRYYPYIIYEIVRDDQYWFKRENDAKWEWVPDFFPLSDGTVALTQNSTSIALTKDSGGDPDFTNITFAESSNLKIWVQETGEILDVDPNPPSAVTATQAYLSNIYTGDSFTGSRFILGRTVTHDNQTFGLNIDTYEPLQVYVNDVKALNRTNYFSREHPAFSPTVGGERQYEYIHSGKNIYFNGPVEGKIRVTYSWLTQYLKLVATMRCNVPVQTIFSPKIDTAKLRVKTTEL